MNVTPLSESPVWLRGSMIDPKRFDTGYYDPALTIAESMMLEGKHVSWKRLRKIGRVYNFGAYELTNDITFVDKSTPGAVPFVTVTNINNLTIDYDAAPWIDQASHRLLSASVCRPGIVMVSIAGTIGRAGVVPATLPECNGNQAIAKIEVNVEESDPYFLTAYLSTRVGSAASEREAAGAVQKNLYIYNVEEIPVPCPEKPIRTAIGHKVRTAEILRAKAIGRLRQAETRLFDQLELSGLQISGTRYGWTEPELFNSVRTDAEYYQPHFIALQRKLESYGESGISISLLGSLKLSGGYGTLPSSDDYGNGDMPFLRAQDVGHFILEADDPVLVPRHYSNPKAIAREGELLLEVKGQLAGGCLCPRYADGWLVNGSVYRMTLRNEIDAGYVLAVLLSPLGVLQKRRAAANNIISYLSVDFLDALQIPRLSDVEEREIGDCIRFYSDGIIKSKQLLAMAIADVEYLIDGKLDEAACIAEGRKLAEEFGLEVP
jgi:type I restriction enzyme S subunit